MKTLLAIPLLSSALFSADARLAASATVSAPSLGYLVQGTDAHPVAGIPGAALVGRAIEWRSLKPLLVSIAPRRAYGLAADAGGTYRVDLTTGQLERISTAVPSSVLWSPSGTAAILKTGSRLQIGTARDGAFTVAREIEIDGTALAISDGGGLLAYSRGAGVAQVLATVDAAGEERTVLSADRIEAAVFLHGGEDLAAIADGKLYLLRNGLDAGIVGEAAQASALAVSADNARLFLASREGRSVTTLRLSDGARSVAACNCSPDRMEPLAGDALFRLTGFDDGPAWLFQSGAPTEITFVPRPEARHE